MLGEEQLDAYLVMLVLELGLSHASYKTFKLFFNKLKLDVPNLNDYLSFLC